MCQVFYTGEMISDVPGILYRRLISDMSGADKREVRDNREKW